MRTNIRDIGSLANDLTIAGKFDVGSAELTARAGFFYMDQDIAMDWHVNKSLREVSGDNPAQLDLYSTTGGAADPGRHLGLQQQLGQLLRPRL